MSKQSRSNAWMRRMARILCHQLRVVALLAVLPVAAWAQGGPPLVTDDPETPGDGHWEINLASIVSRTDARREILLPDADINYGLGEHVQLKVDVPWAFARDGSWKSGLGDSNVGVKWRFVDIEDSGFSMSTYPQYSSGWIASSRRRGVATDLHQFLAPLEFSTTAGSFVVDGEVGRNFVHGGESEWVAGGVVAHACGAEGECLLEIRETNAPSGTRSLVNLGLHWKASEQLALLAAVGREFGPQEADPQRLLVYLGIQVLR